MINSKKANLKIFKDWMKKNLPFFCQKSSWIFIMLLILAAGYLVYLWYFFVFNFSWNQTEREFYLREKSQDVSLNAEKLEATVSEYSRKQNELKKEPSKIEDIFHLKQQSSPSVEESISEVGRKD